VDLTVVIPTRDRWSVLRETLRSLTAQDLGSFAVEILVVDNGSSEPPPDLGDVRVVSEPVPGAAAARNRGVAEARSDLILFTDDDKRPASAGVLRGHIEAHAAGDTFLAVMGRVVADPSVVDTRFMRWLVASGKLMDEEEATGDWRTFYTGNVSLRRSAILAVGGFDERFAGAGWEDTDLALRLEDQGVRISHRPDLVVHHVHGFDVAASLRRMEGVGRGAALLERLHSFRDPLPGPAKSRARLFVGRVLPPVPGAWRALHLRAYARGYAASALSDDPAQRGYGRVFPMSRPPISVVVPFLGAREEGEQVESALASLRRRAGDEVVLVDNGETPVLSHATHAPEQASSYFARNAGAASAAGEWLLFVDADCRPRATLLDDYFAERIDDRCGVVSGRVIAAGGQSSLAARYARSREHLSQAAAFRHPHRPFGVTANLLVRRAAFEQVGGFQQGIRSGGDAELCWRIQDAGWTMTHREAAAVEHEHRETVRALARQAARYAAGRAWLARHRPGSSPRPKATRRLVRVAAGAVAWTALGRRERAAFKLVDGVVVVAESVGWWLSNDAAYRGPEPHGGAALVADERVPDGAHLAEAARRTDRPNWEASRGARVRYATDDGWARRARDTALLLGRVRPADAPAARRLKKAAVDRLIAGPGAEARAARLSRALRKHPA
jgi:GT2 family glycosyltransferase